MIDHKADATRNYHKVFTICRLPTNIDYHLLAACPILAVYQLDGGY